MLKRFPRSFANSTPFVRWLVVLLFACTPLVGWGQRLLSGASGSSVQQNFDSLAVAGSWSQGATLRGWYARTTATSTVSTYALNTGSTTTAGLYSLGSTGNNDRALGYGTSNSYTGTAGSGSNFLGWRLKNTTGQPILSITITYSGEQWRRDNAATQSMTVSYLTSTTALDASSLVASGYSANIAALTFNSPQVGSTAAALDGNVAANRVAGLTATIDLSAQPLAAGSEIMIRWADVNDSGNDHILGIDDVSVSFTTGTPPADTTPPVFASGSPSTSGVTTSGFTLSSTINEVGTTYYVVLPSGAAAPTAAQVKAGQNASGTAVAANLRGSIINATANTAATAAVSGLSGSTAYDVYVVAEDGVPNLQTTPVKVTVTTLTPDTTPPVFANGSPAASGVTASGFTLSSTINEVGKTYYVVLPSGASAPTAAQVKAGQNAGGSAATPAGSITNATANTAATASVSGLSANTTYDVYVVAEDAVPNLQTTPVRITVTTPSLTPTISSFTPTSGPVGTSVTITGANFTGATAVSFNGTVATTFSVTNNTTISATVPTGATTGTISVTTPNGTATSTDPFTVTLPPVPGQLVISQLYSAGGNNGATYRSDYVELFNRSTSSIGLSGYSIAYFSSSSGAGGTVSLTGSIDPGKYYLIQLASGSNGVALPTPDVTNTTVGMSASAGRVDLLSGTTLLDRVGYGPADTYEGTGPAPAPSTTNAIFRAGNGCTDTDDNSADFATAAAGPRNSASTANPCNTPSLTAAPTTLSLTAQVGQTATGNYTLTGSNLGNAGTVSISSSSPAVLVSVNGSAFAQTATATASASGALNQVVNVQYTAPAASGTASATISNDITVGASTLAAPVTVNTTATPAPAAEPTVQPTVAVSNVTSTSADITVAGGNGTARLVVIRPSSATAVAPADGTSYTASPAYGGTTTGANNSVVLSGTATTVTVTGLSLLTDYTVEVYAYNGSGGSENYLTTAPGTATFTTPAPPALTWDGGGDGTSFADALNWVGDVAPTTGSAVLFDHSVVTGTYNVNFPAGSPSQLSLASLVINPGGGAPITVTLPSTNTTSNYLRLTRSSAALVIYSGGTFLNSSGSTTGTPVDVTTGTENFIIYNGGSYVHQTGRSVSDLLDNLSTAAGTETGRFVYNAPGSAYTLSLSGRTYGSLVLQATASTSLSYTGAGSSELIIRGNLEIDSNVTFAPTLNADISIGGNLSNGGNFRFAPATGTTRRFLVLNGTTAQTISGNPLMAGTSGTSYLGNNVALRINNAAGITLATPVTINGGASSAAARGGLDLVAGVLTTTSTNLLTLNTNATILNTAGPSSFVNGPLARTVAAGTTGDVLFPLGKGTAYRPLILTPSTLANPTTFTAEQKEGRPVAGPALTGGLTRVSQVRQFTVTPSPVPAAGEFAGTITLSFGADDQVTDPAASTLVIAKNSGSSWENIGRSTNTGTSNGGAYVAGSLTSDTFTSFSDFALASTDPLNATNPLPVVLTSFTAQRQSEAALLQWTTAQEKNSAFFDVQRSADGREFQTLGRVEAAGDATSTRRYAFHDATAPAGTVYYRLRQVDRDATATLSEVRVLGGKAAPATLYPNPAHEQLRVASAAPVKGWRVLSLTGKVLLSGTVLEAGIDVSRLAAGSYALELQTIDGARTTLRFVKQ